MQATYSNYDSDSFIYGSKNRVGGLNPNQEFRPQPQKVGNGAGLLISVKSDVIGRVSIDFTNIIEEPYAFIETFDVNVNDSKVLLVTIKAENFRVRFRNLSSQKQNKLKLFTFILPTSPVVSINPDTLPFNLDASNNLIVCMRDSFGNPLTSITPALYGANVLATHNIGDYSKYELVPFDDSTVNIIKSQRVNINKYRTFDILLYNITATNLVPIRFYVQTADDDDIEFVNTQYYVDIYYGMDTANISGITVNTKYVRLLGEYKSLVPFDSRLTVGSGYIVCKS
jgi:hypothetical protein